MTTRTSLKCLLSFCLFLLMLGLSACSSDRALQPVRTQIDAKNKTVMAEYESTVSFSAPDTFVKGSKIGNNSGLTSMHAKVRLSSTYKCVNGRIHLVNPKIDVLDYTASIRYDKSFENKTSSIEFIKVKAHEQDHYARFMTGKMPLAAFSFARNAAAKAAYERFLISMEGSAQYAAYLVLVTG